MGQTWLDLLFAHWPVAAEVLRPKVPQQIPLDTFGGNPWIGVTPFEVRGLRLRGTPPAPGLSRFPEVNVRTYTTVRGKPGIFFMSLDAASIPAVAAARRVYRLPYFRAAMQIGRRGREIQYRSSRNSSDGEPASLQLSYWPTGPVKPAEPVTLEHFLVERYCLYTLDDQGQVLRGDIHHPPWPLQPAAARISLNTMGSPYRVPFETEPLLHYSRRQDVVIWSLAAV
jgi:uncharacterized protein YqjF (DUF2071 family)